MAVYCVSSRPQSVKEAIKPDPLWGPRKPEHRTGRYAAANAAYVTDDADGGDVTGLNGSPKSNGPSDVELGGPSYVEEERTGL